VTVPEWTASGATAGQELAPAPAVASGAALLVRRAAGDGAIPVRGRDRP
jgi:hypothetical protein